MSDNSLDKNPCKGKLFLTEEEKEERIQKWQSLCKSVEKKSKFSRLWRSDELKGKGSKKTFWEHLPDNEGMDQNDSKIIKKASKKLAHLPKNKGMDQNDSKTMKKASKKLAHLPDNKGMLQKDLKTIKKAPINSATKQKKNVHIHSDVTIVQKITTPTPRRPYGKTTEKCGNQNSSETHSDVRETSKIKKIENKRDQNVTVSKLKNATRFSKRLYGKKCENKSNQNIPTTKRIRKISQSLTTPTAKKSEMSTTPTPKNSEPSITPAPKNSETSTTSTLNNLRPSKHQLPTRDITCQTDSPLISQKKCRETFAQTDDPFNALSTEEKNILLNDFLDIILKRNESKVIQDGKFTEWSKLFFQVCCQSSIPPDEIQAHIKKNMVMDNIDTITKTIEKDLHSQLGKLLLLRKQTENDSLKDDIAKEWHRLTTVLPLKEVVLYSRYILKK